MATSLIGKIDTFDDASEKSYVERLEQYFLANEVDAGKQVPVLLSVIGGPTYSLLRDLTAPDKPADKSYQEIVDVLKNHLSPKPINIAERFRFHKRDQKSDESVKDYTAQLRKLSEHCAFGAALDNTLRDRLVSGLRWKNTQKKLLSIDKLTLNKALEICVAMETATKDAAELQNRNRDSAPVNKIKVTPKPIKKQWQKGAKWFLVVEERSWTERMLLPKDRM